MKSFRENKVLRKFTKVIPQIQSNDGSDDYSRANEHGYDFLTIIIYICISLGETLFLGLVTNVTNITEIRKKVISGQVNCVLIKPSLIPRYVYHHQVFMMSALYFQPPGGGHSSQ